MGLLALRQRQFKELLLSARDPAGTGIQGHLEVYRNAYAIRMSESLLEDFPHTLDAVEEFMGGCPVAWVNTYLEQHPSRYASLAEVGSDFARFLSGSDAVRAIPWISDLARLEWAGILARTAGRGSQLPRSQAVLCDRDELRLQLSPSVQLIRSEWQVQRWTKKQVPVQSPVALLVYDREEDDPWEEVSPEQAALLERALQGVPLDRLIEGLHASETEVIQWLRKWSESGAIAGVF